MIHFNMNRPRLTKIHLIVLVLLSLSGCTVLESPPAPTDYRLELAPEHLPQVSYHGGILRVERPQAEASVNARNIAYRTAPYQLRYYTQNRWADAPTRMLGTILTSAFDASGLFTTVIDSNQLSPNYLLTSQLLRLEQQLPAGEQPIVQLQLRYQLIALPKRQLLTSGLIDVQAPSAESNAPAAVAAANAALTDLLAQLVTTVAAVLP